MTWNATARSGDRYAALCVVNHELTREPGCSAAAFANAFWTPGVVAGPLSDFATRTTGFRLPLPNRWRIFWPFSYAEYPGIENDWNQRLESWAAENAPTTVSA